MMDYEKAYKAVLQTATQWIKDGCTDKERICLESVFPELRESEDEEIRKYLIEELKASKSVGELKFSIPAQTKEKCIAYLEKQKEQKPAWSEDYREEDIQTRFAFYTYKDDPGVLYLSNVFVEETSRNHGFGTRILKAAEKAAEAIGAIKICLKVKQDSPANAWYRKHGYGYVAFDDGYDWLEKNSEYLKPAQPAEWSEEDEKIYNSFKTICQKLIENPHGEKFEVELSYALID